MAIGDVAAFLGNFTEAAELYTRAGDGSMHNGSRRIVDMYADLRRFDDAREAMSGCVDGDGPDEQERKRLLTKHAEWARSTNEHRTAAKMYIAAGDYTQAILLASEHKCTDM